MYRLRQIKARWTRRQHWRWNWRAELARLIVVPKTAVAWQDNILYDPIDPDDEGEIRATYNEYTQGIATELLTSLVAKLPTELQVEVFSHVEPREVEPWLYLGAAHRSAKARYWSEIGLGECGGPQTQERMKRVFAFCDFIESDQSSAIRTLIREVRIAVPEPWRTPVPGQDPANIGSEVEEFWLPQAWDIPRVEAMLARLTNLRTLVAVLYRPECPEQGYRDIDFLSTSTLPFTSWTTLPTVTLPSHVQSLHVKDLRYSLGCKHPTSHLRLFRPGSSLTSLSYVSEDVYAQKAHSWDPSGIYGLKGLSFYPSVKHVVIQTRDTLELLKENRLIECLQLLPRLEVLELYTPVNGSTDEDIFPMDWPSLLPMLKTLRVPLRKLCEYVATTSAKDTITFEVLVDHPEVEKAGNHYQTLDDDYIVPFFKLLEEVAHYLSTSGTDNRRLKIRPINADKLRDNFYHYERWLFDGDDSPADLYFNDMVPRMLATMPAVASERGGVPWPRPPQEYLSEDMSRWFTEWFVGPWFREMASWTPRRNLGLGWEGDETFA